MELFCYTLEGALERRLKTNNTALESIDTS